MFQPMNPTIYPDDRVPEVVPLPWHLKDEDRAETEIARLDDAGIAVTMLLADSDNDAPLEICFSAARMKGGNKIYLLATQADYPQSKPAMRLTPFVSMQAGEKVADLFVEWWQNGTPVTEPPDFVWSPDLHLIDYIEAVEKHMAYIRRPPFPKTATL